MRRFNQIMGALALAAALAGNAIAQGYVTGRYDFISALGGTDYSEQSKSDFFYALRRECNSASGDSVRAFRLGGGNSPVARINHTCARYTTCDGRVDVPGGTRFNFALNCR